VGRSTHRTCVPVNEKLVGHRVAGAGVDSPAEPAEPRSLAALCERYRPLIGAIVARYRSLPVGVERSDVEQEAARALCELALEYEPARGIPLSAYLRAKLGWRVSHYLRQEKRRTGHLPLDSVDLEAVRESVVESPSPGIASPRIARAIGRLSPRQRAVIAGVFWRERTEKEIARELNVSHQTVTALRRRAEASLRKQLRPDDA
jgi:RNA polymerase sigma factor (sigma-70 family)